jgi:succinoglycan biosynthesis transport protein ExoP
MTPSEPWALQEAGTPMSAPSVGSFWAVVVRNWLIILGCTILVTAGVIWYTLQQTPSFDASATIRIQDREPNLPDIYRAASSAGSEIATEMLVLGSRALKEDAAASLSLQLYVTEPSRVARGVLLDRIIVAANAPVAEYRLTRRPDGRYAVVTADSGKPVTVGEPDGTVRVPGASFHVKPDASHYQQLGIGIQSTDDVIDRLGSITVSQPDRTANIVSLTYSDPDSLIAREVPNFIASRYLARRQQSQSAEASSTAQFLHQQLARVSSELAESEQAFRSFREREQVLDPTVETSSGVSRLISKESERSALEAERDALSKSLADIDKGSAGPGSPSPYRQLIGLPFLLRNEAASALLSALIAAESQKAALVSATAQDPDMRVLQAKIADLEQQLHSITTTYLQGLSNQVSSMDATLASYSRELNTIPRKQLEYGRLERNVKGLETVYELLQGRLNEAEIAVAVKDASVQVVDSAVTPVSPSSPRPAINLAAGLAVSLMLGLGLAFIREYRDKSVHSRRDVLVATGVPVLGLIPRIAKARKPIALITGRRPVGSGDASRRRSGNGRPERFTFLTPPRELVEAGDAALMPSSAHPAATGMELTMSDWNPMVAEACGLLVANITFARTEPTKVVVVTSPLAGDGKTTCAVNLAITLAMRRSRTILVDADLRRGVVHTTMGAPRAPGLSEVLSSSRTVDQAIRAIKVGDHGDWLHFLTTGSVTPNPSVLLESSEFKALLERLKGEYDAIIIDSPPVNIISDASTLGVLADAVLIIARSGVTDSAALAHAVEQLTRARVPLLGVVLNDIDFKREATYDASYRSYNVSEYLSASSES